MKNLNVFLWGFAFLFLVACNPDDEMMDDEMPGMTNPCLMDNLSSGMLVVNEGPFNSGSGTISANDADAGVLQDLFQRNNCDEELGNIVQSLFIYGDKIFIAVNNADKVVVVDANSFEKLGSIDNVSLPRYMAAGDNGALYLSRWGDTGANGTLEEIDTSTLTVTRSLEMRTAPEEILFNDGKIYVPNSGAFGRDSVLTIVDAENWQVLSEVVVGDNPQSLVVQGNSIWCLAGGYTDFATYESTPGALVQLTNDMITKSVEVPNGASNLVYQPNLNKFYWHTFSTIYTITPTMDAPEIFLSRNTYDLGIDLSTNQLYACDAGNFADPGQILRIETSSAAILDSIPAGISPGEVYFY